MQQIPPCRVGFLCMSEGGQGDVFSNIDSVSLLTGYVIAFNSFYSNKKAPAYTRAFTFEFLLLNFNSPFPFRPAFRLGLELQILVQACQL
jgi:hypothetical protein